MGSNLGRVSPVAAPLGVGRIPLRDRHGEVRAWATVDLADYHDVSQRRWCLNDSGYAVRNRPRPNRTKIRMHRVILGLADDDPREVDHIDRDPLNNRRANLRAVTHQQNRQNTKGWDNSTSRHKGVHYCRTRKRWVAQGSLNGRRVLIGRFVLEDDAGVARRAWEREHMPYAEPS